jgi:hypothetical protein
MCDAFVERGEAQAMRRCQISKIDVGCIARGSDDLAIESAPVTRNDKGRFLKARPDSSRTAK